MRLLVPMRSAALALAGSFAMSVSALGQIPPRCVPVENKALGYSVVSFVQGTTAGGATIAAAYSDPSRALGLAQNSDGNNGPANANYVSLGFDNTDTRGREGVIVIRMSYDITNVSGADFTIYESGDASLTGYNLPESADVQGSIDGTTWYTLTAVGEDPSLPLGRIVSDGKIDISAMPLNGSGQRVVRYVRLTDRTPHTSYIFNSGADGFDLDGIMGYACDLQRGLSLRLDADEDGTAPVPALAVAPNPIAKGSALSVTLTLAEAARQQVRILDMTGKTVAVLADGPLPAGTTTLTWNAQAPRAGLYMVQATGAGLNSTARVVLTD